MLAGDDPERAAELAVGSARAGGERASRAARNRRLGRAAARRARASSPARRGGGGRQQASWCSAGDRGVTRIAARSARARQTRPCSRKRLRSGASSANRSRPPGSSSRLARLSGARLEAERIERELRKLGFRDTAGRSAGVLMAAGSEGPAPLTLQTLGGFRVLRQGIPSRRRRGSRRRHAISSRSWPRAAGKPVARDALIEALWPDEDPSKTGNRLSVALSTLEIRPRPRTGASARTTSSCPPMARFACRSKPSASTSNRSWRPRRKASARRSGSAGADPARARRGRLHGRLPRRGPLRGLGDTAPQRGASRLHRRAAGAGGDHWGSQVLPAHHRPRPVRRARSPGARRGAAGAAGRTARRGAPTGPTSRGCKRSEPSPHRFPGRL